MIAVIADAHELVGFLFYFACRANSSVIFVSLVRIKMNIVRAPMSTPFIAWSRSLRMRSMRAVTSLSFRFSFCIMKMGNDE